MRLPPHCKENLRDFRIPASSRGLRVLLRDTPHHSSSPPESAEDLLERADTLAWGNRWAAALPLYQKAQQLYTKQNELPKLCMLRSVQFPRMSL
jgi:hypothetical protein